MIYTAIAAGALGILLSLLGSAISLRRITGKGEGERFERLRRIHGNAIEHVPIMLILILVSEALAAPRWLLLAAVITAVFARLIHAVGYFIRRRHPLHFAGATLTYIIEGGLGLFVLIKGLQRL